MERGNTLPHFIFQIHRGLIMAKDKDWMKNYQLKWMMDRKAKYLDGKRCFFCGSDREIEIHHIDPGEKESHKIWSWSEERIENELKKCIFICCDCHSKLHALARRIPLIHGTLNGYDKYKCRCALCRAKKQYHRVKHRYEGMTVDEVYDEFNQRYGVDRSFVERMVG